MPDLKYKEELENPKVLENGAMLPVHQKHSSGGHNSVMVYNATPTPATNILGSGNTYNFDIEPDTVGRVDELCLRLKITCSNADVETVMPDYFFSKIILENEKGSKEELIHIYPENTIMWRHLTQNRNAREKSSWLENFHRTENQSENSEKYWISEKTKFRAGETRDIYIPLAALFVHLNALDFKQIRQDFRIRLEFSSDIIVSGDRNNLSLDSLDAVIQTFNEEAYDYQYRMNKLKKYNHKYIYLDHERLVYNDKTLTAGATTRFPLDQFTGRCPFLVVVIKPNQTPVASDKSLFNFQEIGVNGTFDITNSSSQSIYGNGTAVKQDYLYHMFSQQSDNPHIKGVYVIPFCDNIRKAITGSTQGGSWNFVGIKDYLEITFDSAPTSEVHTISTDSLGVTGSYRYGFENGIISDQDLSYDASATDIQTVINAIPQLKENNISVTVNDGIDAVTSQTITYDSNAGKVSNNLGKITILGNGTPKVNSTSVTTQGNKGWTSGSNYQVEIYMYKFKGLQVDTDGRMSTRDL